MSSLMMLLFFSLNIENAFSYSSLTSAQRQQLQSLKETIVALDSTRDKSYSEKQKLVSRQMLSLEKTIEDYTVFINFLSVKIQNYCNTIINDFGPKFIADLPCYSNYQGINGLKDNQRKIKTASEEVESFENEFIKSMGEFDEMLLKEDELAKNMSRSNASSGEQKGSGELSSSDTSYNRSNKTERSEKKSGQEKDNNKNDKRSENSDEQTGSQTKGQQKKASKINAREKRKLDKIDDDIVARQLKEAAEKETDPKLKEKLWNEYYNYKKSSSR
jgi:hypothetical protein